MSGKGAIGFMRAGMLFLEPPHRWRIFDRGIWQRCDNRRGEIVPVRPRYPEKKKWGPRS